MRWGPTIIAPGRARFSLWAPDRDALTLEIEGRDATAMERRPGGWFVCEAAARSEERYRFRLDAGLAVPDPASRAQSGGPEGGVHGWSVLVDPDAYRWRTHDWRGRPWEEAVIYEVHVGVLGGFSGVAERLPELADIGVTAIELMPVAAFSGARNWGYDGVLPYAVAESYGTPDDLKALVDRAHELGVMVLLDVVYNHFGPDGNYLGAYASAFFDEHAHTPWGGAVAVSREPVRRFFIDNALMWLEDYRIDGLRFDAVHAIADNAFLDAMAGEIRERVTGRAVHLVLENERNDPDRLAPGLYDAQWNDDFHNAAHVLLTGESEGYYRAFGGDPTSKLARCLAEGFAFQGEDAGDGADENEGAGPRGAPSDHLPPSAFVSFLQNHDQIGNRALGERLTMLADPAKLRAATALLLLCPQIPLLFMGEEAGSRSPFLFFTDFHDELADAVREGRRKEFAHFAAFADPAARETIPDPNDPASFAASYPRPGPDAIEWRALYVELLAIRHRHIVPRLRGARGLDAEVSGAEVLGVEVSGAEVREDGEREGALSARWRLGDGAVLTLALNLGSRAVCFQQGEGKPLFALGQAGEPGSFAAWLAP